MKLDRLAFQEALDEIGAKAETGTNFSLQVLPERFERGVELLADNLLRPAFPETAFKALQQRTRQAVAGQLQSPVYLSQRAFLQAIYPEKDPTLRQATPETVGSLKLEDVHAYYERSFGLTSQLLSLLGRSRRIRRRPLLKNISVHGRPPDRSRRRISRRCRVTRLAPPLYRTGAGSG